MVQLYLNNVWIFIIDVNVCEVQIQLLGNLDWKINFSIHLLKQSDAFW